MLFRNAKIFTEEHGFVHGCFRVEDGRFAELVIGSSEEPGVIGAASERAHVTAELICDGLHVHPSAIRMAFRRKLPRSSRPGSQVRQPSMRLPVFLYQ